ncbi:MAG TPA: protein kinase, partial [Anaerolineales bacterium]|nr:protein kinase [Anaerolineales bacterium]
YLSEGRSWLDEILARLEESPTEISSPEVLAAVYIAAADLAEVQRDYPKLRHFLEKAHPLWHRTENPTGIAKSYLFLGRMYHDLEQFDQAEAAISQGLTLARELGQPSLILTALNSLGNLAHYRGELPKAQIYIEECLSLARQQGNVIRVSTALGNLGSIHQVQGNYPLARKFFEEALSMFRALGFKERVAGVLGNLGNTGLKIDDLDFAEARYVECLQIRRELGLQEQTDQPLHGLGIVASRRGDTRKALAFLSESLTVQHASGKVRGLPSLIETIGNIALEKGLAKEAANLYGAMEALGERKITAARSPYGQATYDQHVEEMRRQLSTDSFTQAWQTGRALSLEEAIALARTLSTLLEETSPVNQPTRGTQVKPSSPPARYVQEDLLAIGGMGEVYRGRESSTGQLVAIKKIKADLLPTDAETVARFVREGELLRQLNHPNIVKMLAFQRENGHFWLVMEYVPGGTLRNLLDEHPHLPIQQVLSLALELADALARAHHLHILHRDLKPENILLAADGTPRLTDFGLAYHMGSDPRLTQPGLVVGTTAYLSPEACMGEVLDTRSDVWSFGVVLFEMLTGQNPFRAENRMTTLVNILTRPLPDLSTLRPDTPPAVISLVARMVNKESTNRLGSMRQVAAELEQGVKRRCC